MAHDDLLRWEMYLLSAIMMGLLFVSMPALGRRINIFVHRFVPERFAFLQKVIALALLLAVSTVTVIVLFTAMLVVLYAIGQA